MKRILLLTVLALALGYATAEAQTTVAVDLNKAKISWDWTQGAGGVPDEFRVKCGTSSGNYSRVTAIANITVREAAVKDVITGSGNWFCVVTVANAFGESEPSNEVPFAAGAAPSKATNARITAQ